MTDEGGVPDLAQVLLIVVSIDFGNLIILGNSAPQVSGPLGCIKELSESLITYIRANYWGASKNKLVIRDLKACYVVAKFEKISY